MININKNNVLNQLEEFLKTNTDHFPNSFYKEQKKVLEFFNNKILFDQIIEESISFNKKLVWDNSNNNLQLTTTAEELIEVFKLRSTVFTDVNYQNEFPDTIEGLNFDIFDKNSAIIYYKNNHEVTASIRLIFDSVNKLPSEKSFSFDEFRKKHNCIGEISRNIIKYRGKGLNLEFKYLMCGIYNIFINNDIDIALCGIKEDHLKLFKKLGGVNIVEKIDSYGTLDTPCLIISYNPNEASSFFKKVFLK